MGGAVEDEGGATNPSLDSPTSPPPRPANADNPRSPQVRPCPPLSSFLSRARALTEKENAPLVVAIVGCMAVLATSAQVTWPTPGPSPLSFYFILFPNSTWNSCWAGPLFKNRVAQAFPAPF
jgi:hypothetical protein